MRTIADRSGDETSPPRIGVLPNGRVAVDWRQASRRSRRLASSVAGLTILGLILVWLFRGSPFGLPGIIGLLLGVVLPLLTILGWMAGSAIRSHRVHIDIPDERRIPELPAWTRHGDRALVDRIRESFTLPTGPLEGRIAIVHESIAAIVDLDPDDRLLEEEPLTQGGEVLWPVLISVLSIAPMIGVGILAAAIGASTWTFLPFLVIVAIGQLPQLDLLVRRLLWRRYTMGPGFVHDLRTGRTIGGDDAILFARPAWVDPLGQGRHVKADLLGPDVHLRLRFVDPSSPTFLAFWRRWCHPRPRPELKATPRDEANRPGTAPPNVGD